jgi:hypothetical protein
LTHYYNQVVKREIRLLRRAAEPRRFGCFRNLLAESFSLINRLFDSQFEIAIFLVVMSTILDDGLILSWGQRTEPWIACIKPYSSNCDIFTGGMVGRAR